MRSQALKVQDVNQDNAHVPAKWQKITHLQLVFVDNAPKPADSQYGPDLGEFEETYLLGAPSFA